MENKRRLMDTEDRLTAVGGEGARGWAKKVKGLSKEKNLIDTDNSVVITRSMGWAGEVDECEGGMNGDGRGHLTWGGEHTIQYIDDVL